MSEKKALSTATKIFLSIASLLWFGVSAFLLKDQMGNPNYDLFGIIIGSFFGLMGVFTLSVAWCYDRWQLIENDKSKVRLIKLFVKSLGTFGILLLSYAVFYAALFSKPDDIKNEDLSFIAGTLRSVPVFEKGPKASTNMNFYLNEYPDFIFEPRYEGFIHYNTSLESEVHTGDSIYLGLTHEDFNKYITKTETPTYLDRHVNYRFIPVYYIQVGDVAYYSPDIHNYMDAEDHKYMPWVVILGLVPLLALISIWYTQFIRLLEQIGFTRPIPYLRRLREKRIL